LRTDNFDLTQTHHHWVSDFEIVTESQPEWAMVIERLSNDGRFNGTPVAFLDHTKEIATDPATIWAKFNEHHAETRNVVNRIEHIKKAEIGGVSRKEEEARLTLRSAELTHGKDSSQYNAAEQRYQEVKKWAAQEHARLNADVTSLQRENQRFQL